MSMQRGIELHGKSKSWPIAKDEKRGKKEIGKYLANKASSGCQRIQNELNLTPLMTVLYTLPK